MFILRALIESHTDEETIRERGNIKSQQKKENKKQYKKHRREKTIRKKEGQNNKKRPKGDGH